MHIPDNAKFGKLKLGFGRVQIADSKYSRFIWNMSKKSEIHFGNNVKIGTGSKLHNQGRITIGTGVNFSGKATIICNKSISFGNECLVSWQTLFMDSDLHKITDSNGNTLNSDANVIIEDRVWVGAKATVLKGSKVARSCVIASGAVVVGTYPPKSILGGNPAKVIGDMDGKQFHH
ncbi:acyltransferase [Vibrio kasasachensis]|uniref:acyltransferase n=1 Tax=Vibrio kasasachensis TaxID=2910248 RepID=UPI003D11AB76